ncbi:MAG: GTP-binding protein, partial [Desulfobulbaceae bacterium]|nr:GTP-binding protein [Desulfobulbaceae bacterium]
QGRIFRDGISVVILGRPNVGKSSLLNSLLKEERAIVTPVPGTTRDTIEEYLNVKGVPVRIIDTAGIRDHAEPVEEIGIQRARDKMAGADLVLLLLDGSAPPTDEDLRLYRGLADRPHLLVVNKMDIADSGQAMAAMAAAFPANKPVPVSAKTGWGIDQLEEAIFAAVTHEGRLRDPEHACVPNLRHKTALSRALAACQLVTAGLAEGLPADLVSVDLQSALDHLGDIVGATTPDDVLDMIFERFCIGK